MTIFSFQREKGQGLSPEKRSHNNTVYILGHSISFWLVWAETKSAMNAALPKWLVNQYKPVEQSRKQALRADWPNTYCA